MILRSSSASKRAPPSSLRWVASWRYEQWHRDLPMRLPNRVRRGCRTECDAGSPLFAGISDFSRGSAHERAILEGKHLRSVEQRRACERVGGTSSGTVICRYEAAEQSATRLPNRVRCWASKQRLCCWLTLCAACERVDGTSSGTVTCRLGCRTECDEAAEQSAMLAHPLLFAGLRVGGTSSGTVICR